MELEKLREEIDRIDAQITSLFLQRMATAKQIGKYKLAHDLPIDNFAREELVKQRAAAAAEGKLSELLETLFEVIITSAKIIQLEPDNHKQGS